MDTLIGAHSISFVRWHSSKMATGAQMLSTITLVCTTIFLCGFASLGTGGIFDACNQYTLAGVTKEECQGFFAEVLGRRPTDEKKILVAFALAFARVKASLFLAMGLGGVYALFNSWPGTPSVAVVHLMQGLFFCTACGVHLHNANLLGFEVDPNLQVDGATFLPIAGLTGLLGVLSWLSFFLSNKPVSTPGLMEEVSAVAEKQEAATKVQAMLRAKKVRDEENMRKRRSSIGSAEL